MCRLFGQVSLIRTSAEDYLAEKRYSLLHQSNCDRRHPQKDGWGITCLSRNERRWQIRKSQDPVFKEKRKFREIAESWKSQMILAHIRHASNPNKLSGRRLIGRENTQPFTFQNLAFAHNGTLNIANEVSETLGGYRKKVRGINDSEILFWLFVKKWNQAERRLKKSTHWKNIFNQMTDDIISVWESIPKSKRKFARPFRGLNYIASDGKSMAAHCFYEKNEGKSLCKQGRPYFEMCYQAMNDRIVIASEPMDQDPSWTPLLNKHLLVVDNNCRITVNKV